MNSGDATPELDTPIRVLGAGPHGLALALHLRQADPSLAERLVVLDPTGTWMEVWRDQFRRLDIETLRSPGVHHPAPDVDALARHVTEHRLPISGTPYDLPTSAAFSHFCDHLSAEAALAPPLARRATAVHRVDDGLLVETDGPTVRTERLVVLPDIALIDGVPVPDAGLRVGAPPVHVMGRLATIELGPAAGNLWGARMAARRITRAVTGIDLEQHSLQPEQRVRAPRRLSVRRRHAG